MQTEQKSVAKPVPRPIPKGQVEMLHPDNDGSPSKIRQAAQQQLNVKQIRVPAPGGMVIKQKNIERAQPEHLDAPQSTFETYINHQLPPVKVFVGSEEWTDTKVNEFN